MEGSMFKTEDDTTLHKGFEQLAKNTFKTATMLSSTLKNGRSILKFGSKQVNDSPSLPDVSLRQLFNLSSSSRVQGLEVCIGSISDQLIVSARKLAAEDKQDPNKRSKTSENAATSAKVPTTEDTSDTSGTATTPTVERIRRLGVRLRTLTDPWSSSTNSVFDSVVVQMSEKNASADNALSRSTTPPAATLVAKIVSGVALSLHKLQTLCEEENVQDGILTSNTTRQKALGEVGTSSWRVGCSRGLVSFTLILAV